MRVLPDELRDLLKEPIGQLVNEKQLLEILKDEKYIISIGDTVTYTILKHDIKPVFCIVDYKTRRGACDQEVVDLIKSFGKKSVVVKNPAATITDGLWNVIKFAFEDLEKILFELRLKVKRILQALLLFIWPLET